MNTSNESNQMNSPPLPALPPGEYLATKEGRDSIAVRLLPNGEWMQEGWESLDLRTVGYTLHAIHALLAAKAARYQILPNGVMVKLGYSEELAEARFNEHRRMLDAEEYRNERDEARAAQRKAEGERDALRGELADYKDANEEMKREMLSGEARAQAIAEVLEAVPALLDVIHMAQPEMGGNHIYRLDNDRRRVSRAVAALQAALAKLDAINKEIK